MIGVCCLQEVRWRGQGARDERNNISCGGQDKEMVEWELW